MAPQVLGCTSITKKVQTIVNNTQFMPLSLNCLFDGDDPDQTFTVEIPNDKNVSILKDLIKEKKASRLKDIDASDLQLWQVSSKTEHNFAGYPKLSPPTKKLTTFFTDVPDGYLHVIAKAPGTSRQSSLL
jgi:hypothetical protein